MAKTAAMSEYDAARAAINDAYENDEVKAVSGSDEAALAHYRRLALNIEPERQMCEIRLCAEREGIKLAKKLRADDMARLSPEAWKFYRWAMKQ